MFKAAFFSGCRSGPTRKTRCPSEETPMPRPKTPLAKAELTGRTKKNPERFKDRKSNPAGQVEGPPEYFDEAHREAWELAKYAWPWVAVSDAFLLEAFCHMHVKMRDPTVEKNASFFSQYRSYCSAMGGTPSDISRLSAAQLSAASRKGADAPDGEDEVDAQIPDKAQGADRFFVQ